MSDQPRAGHDVIHQCRMCGGDGWTAEHDSHCDGSCRDGLCPVQVQCSWCRGEGTEIQPHDDPDDRGTDDYPF